MSLQRRGRHVKGLGKRRRGGGGRREEEGEDEEGNGKATDTKGGRKKGE